VPDKRNLKNNIKNKIVIRTKPIKISAAETTIEFDNQFSCVEAAVAPKKRSLHHIFIKSWMKYVMCWKALQTYWLKEKYLK
jgi:hypothetical protein